MGRHVARVQITTTLLRQILQFPDSFIVVNGQWDFDTEVMTLVVESSQLYEVPEGSVVPYILPLAHHNDDGSLRVEWPVASD